MTRSHSYLVALGLCLVVIGFAANDAAAAGPRFSGFCERTAEQALTACYYDALDNYYVSRGNCFNESDWQAWWECWNDTRQTRAEERELCRDQFDARLDVCDELGSGRHDPDFDAENFLHPDAIDTQNPYLSLEAGRTAVVRSGESHEELVVTHVTEDVKVIQGVPCRIVIDIALEVGQDDEGGVEYEPLEVTADWYAYHLSGDVWYCGEGTGEFEDGELDNLDGSFEAGKDGAKPGILIQFDPRPGNIYRQEFALGEAEDIARVESLASSPDEEVEGFGCDGMCLQTFDFTPLSPGTEEFKYYLDGIGFVLALSLDHGVPTGEREELVCTGDSLDLLSEQACGIEDPNLLREELCKLAPDALCQD